MLTVFTARSRLEKMNVTHAFYSQPSRASAYPIYGRQRGGFFFYPGKFFGKSIRQTASNLLKKGLAGTLAATELFRAHKYGKKGQKWKAALKGIRKAKKFYRRMKQTKVKDIPKIKTY